MDAANHPVLFAFLGSLVTWAATSLGATVVFLGPKRGLTGRLPALTDPH